MALVKRQRIKIRRAVLNVCNRGNYSDNLRGFPSVSVSFFHVLIRLLEQPIRGICLTDESLLILCVELTIRLWLGLGKKLILNRKFKLICLEDVKNENHERKSLLDQTLIQKRFSLVKARFALIPNREINVDTTLTRHTDSLWQPRHPDTYGECHCIRNMLI